jgi:hypothetical protein
VAEIGLDRPSVVAVVGELEPAGVTQHVGMNGKCEFRGYARPGHHAQIGAMFPSDGFRQISRDLRESKYRCQNCSICATSRYFFTTFTK